MTPDEINDALDAMQTAAGPDTDKRPGLIEIRSDAWVDGLANMPAEKPKTIIDGIRIRDIKVAVGASVATKILSRTEAEGRGEPYRDLTDRP